MSSSVTPPVLLLGFALALSAPGLVGCADPRGEPPRPPEARAPLMTPAEAAAAKMRADEAVSIDRFILLTSAWQLDQRCHVLKPEERQDFARNLAQATQTMSAAASPEKTRQMRAIGQSRAERYTCDGDGRDLIHNAARKSSEALPIEASPTLPRTDAPS